MDCQFNDGYWQTLPITAAQSSLRAMDAWHKGSNFRNGSILTLLRVDIKICNSLSIKKALIAVNHCYQKGFNQSLNIPTRLTLVISVSSFFWYWIRNYPPELGQHPGSLLPGPRLNIKTVFPMHGDSHVKDKTVVRPSYLWHGYPYTDKAAPRLLAMPGNNQQPRCWQKGWTCPCFSRGRVTAPCTSIKKL